MIFIVGNIKVDESNTQRVGQLIACIRSYAFLGKEARFVLHLENASEAFRVAIEKETKRCGFFLSFIFNGQSRSVHYGQTMKSFIEFIANDRLSDFVINFMEDHFMMLDNERVLSNLLGFMRQHKADVCKASFFKVEQNSTRGIVPVADVPGLGICFDNTAENHAAYCQHYGERYYIGVNFITTKDFALRFWDRPLGSRPHEYEIMHHNPNWQHRCVIPGIEILAAIDDDHGEAGSCLYNRPDAKKFWDIYNSI